ncbi:MAG: SAM-dependent methyltransferase [Actinomycetota bacterium]
MAIGPAIRRKLKSHPKIQSKIADAYRSLFIDVDGLVEHIPISQEASSLLNIGTGDGSLLNRLARRFTSLEITTADVYESRGELIEPDVASRIRMVNYLPNDYSAPFWTHRFDIVLLVDVIHHVPTADRPNLLRQVWSSVAPSGTLLVKDVEPRGARAKLGLLSDKYITGDRHVVQVSAADMRALMVESCTNINVRETHLATHDFPNYLLVGQRE